MIDWIFPSLICLIKRKSSPLIGELFFIKANSVAQRGSAVWVQGLPVILSSFSGRIARDLGKLPPKFFQSFSDFFKKDVDILKNIAIINYALRATAQSEKQNSGIV